MRERLSGRRETAFLITGRDMRNSKRRAMVGPSMASIVCRCDQVGDKNSVNAFVKSNDENKVERQRDDYSGQSNYSEPLCSSVDTQRREWDDVQTIEQNNDRTNAKNAREFWNPRRDVDLRVVENRPHKCGSRASKK